MGHSRRARYGAATSLSMRENPYVDPRPPQQHWSACRPSRRKQRHIHRRPDPARTQPHTANQVLAVASGNEVRLWDSANGRTIGGPLTGRTDVIAVAFSPDGSLLAAAGVAAAGGDVQLWDPATGRRVGAPLINNGGRALGVAFSPDSALLATTDAGTVRLWDAKTGRPVGVPIGDGSSPMIDDSDPRNAVAFSPDGRLLASASGQRVTLSDPTIYPDPLPAICDQVGRLSQNEWTTYAPGESRTSAC